MTGPDDPDVAVPEADRPWERPGAVRRDCAPHRGRWFALLASVNFLTIAVVVAAAVFLDDPVSVGVSPGAFVSPGDGRFLLPGGVLCLLLGVVTWALAERDRTRMRGGDMDPAGLGATALAGWAGIASMTVGAIPTLVGVLLLLP